MSTRIQAVAALQDIVGALTGIKGAPDYPETDVILFPYLLAYLSSGNIVGATMDGGTDAVDTITLDLHAGTSENFTAGIRVAAGYLDTILGALEDDGDLNGTVQSIGQITYTLGTLSPWKTIGYRFQIPVTRYDE